MNARSITLGLVLLATLATPAVAGARDDLLQAINKCAGVADNTERLACYDALKPQVTAAIAEPPPQQVAEAAPPGGKENGSSWFGLDNLFSGKAAPQTKPEQFGSDQLPKEQAVKLMPPAIAAAEELDSISATLTDYATNSTGHYIVFLDNGQTWQQAEADIYMPHLRKKAGDNKVVITRGMMGTYEMKVNDANRVYKVRRIK
ncbi:MAG TPA: hypothetical protein VHL34_10480 [Rhizomicrobium sp.]|jgi:hypothetical protein|nr:hypothetical protein [Rhizomicrobium sp.]